MPAFAVSAFLAGPLSRSQAPLGVIIVGISGNLVLYSFLRDLLHFIDRELRRDYLQVAIVRGDSALKHLWRQATAFIAVTIARVAGRPAGSHRQRAPCRASAAQEPRSPTRFDGGRFELS
jgi:hypothetical protein